MKKWRVEVTSSALKELKSFPVNVRTAVRELVRQMADEDCPAIGARKLHEVKGVYEKRVGLNVRIIFSIKDQCITIEDDRKVLLILAVVRRRDMAKIILKAIK